MAPFAKHDGITCGTWLRNSIIAGLVLLAAIAGGNALAEEGPTSPAGQSVPAAAQKIRDGLLLEIEPLKRIYSNREGLLMKFVFTAQSRTKLCLAKDLLSQMQVNISRAGTGRLPLQPLVMRDNSALFSEKMQVRWLEPGQSVMLRANLKRYQFAGSEQWTPGEYNVAATFNLCEQTTEPDVYAGTGEELPVKTVRPGWFMIMI